MAAKWNKIKINITICIFSTLELSSNLGNNKMLMKRERKRLVKEIKRQLNKLFSNRYLENKEADG